MFLFIAKQIKNFPKGREREIEKFKIYAVKIDEKLIEL